MNWVWSLAILLVIGVVLHRSGTASAETVMAHLKQNPVVIDVRTAEEYQGGHVDRAIHIPLSTLRQEIGKNVSVKERPVLLYCASGARSGAGKKILSQLGYTNVHNVGSIARARSLLNI